MVMHTITVTLMVTTRQRNLRDTGRLKILNTVIYMTGIDPTYVVYMYQGAMAACASALCFFFFLTSINLLIV